VTAEIVRIADGQRRIIPRSLRATAKQTIRRARRERLPRWRAPARRLDCNSAAWRFANPCFAQTNGADANNRGPAQRIGKS
jgi:hypothetical protein